MMKFDKNIKLDDDLSFIPFQFDGEKYYVQAFGNVSAGFPSPAEDFVGDRISLDERYLSHPESTFILEVGGLSMCPYYQLHDKLIVRSDLRANHNNDIIVSVNNEKYTFKWYDKHNRKLVSLNPDYEKSIQLLDTDHVMILGVVSSMFRDIRLY